ncbi:hypothetical protein SynMINOS11_01658 [Synechococcus sp. Minos11]|nr:hypothetical protein SynMINOS11_01658 [Synechococcus sp. Minos11]
MICLAGYRSFAQAESGSVPSLLADAPIVQLPRLRAID